MNGMPAVRSCSLSLHASSKATHLESGLIGLRVEGLEFKVSECLQVYPFYRAY